MGTTRHRNPSVKNALSGGVRVTRAGVASSQSLKETQVISFKVEGIPRPQGSKRHVGGGRMIESSKHVAAWREWVRLKASQAMSGLPPISGPIVMSIQFGFDRPKKHYLSKGLRLDAPFFHTSKPDVDKLLRAMLDAMTGVVFNDDSQVSIVNCIKQYQTSPSTEVEVSCCVPVSVARRE